MRRSSSLAWVCALLLSACGAATVADGGLGGGAGGGGGDFDAGCEMGWELRLGTGAFTLEDDLSSGSDHVTPSCGSAGRRDRVLQFELTETEDVFVQVSSSTWQPVIALYSPDACSLELQCAAANLQGQTSLTATGLAPGRYALVVDGVGSLPSGAYELYVERPAVQPTALANGVAVPGLSAVIGQWLYYAVTLPSSAALTVTTSGGSGNADLYLARAKPTTTASLQKSTAAGNDEAVSEATAADGTWIIGVYAKTSYSGLSLVATW